MPRATCALVAVVALLVSGAPARPAAQASSRVDDLLARYAAGENVFAATFPDSFTFLGWRVEIFSRARQWRDPWTPIGAAFLLELSFYASLQGWPDDVLILRAAEDVVTGRRAEPGTAPDQDRFEATFHRAALAWLIGARSLAPAREYLRRVEDRSGPEDPRLVLARGVIEEVWTSPAVLPPQDDAGLPSLVIQSRDRERRLHLERALAAYEPALALPDSIAAEAAVRRAFVLHRLGRHEDARAALTGLTGTIADPAVRYWRALFLGRVLEALERPEEAAEAYRTALEAWSGAQTPAVALAALFQRQGQPVEARRWARIAGTTAPGSIDPWWQYWSGDLRLVPAWLDELRGTTP